MLSSIPASDTSEPASAPARRASGFWADVLHRVVRTRAAVVGGILVGSFLVVALLAPVVAPYNPLKGQLGERLQPPSSVHWLGTDELGRDVLSRILHGARITVQIQLAAVGLALALGTALGLTAGYVGRWVDQLIMRFMDILMAFPGIFLALAIIAALGTGQGNLVMATGIFLVPQFARVVHASILTLKDLQFVQAARAGARGRRARVSLPGSQLFGADHRPDQPPNGDGAPHGVRSLVPRAGRAAAIPGMGGDALQRSLVHDRCAARRDHAGARDHAGGPWLQPLGRRSPRLA